MSGTLFNLYCKNKAFFIFFFAFIFTCAIGMCLTQYNMPETNIYFGADNARAFDDLTTITDVTHYRIKVHPLLLILIQPAILLLNGIVNHSNSVIVISGALICAANSLGIRQIISRYTKDELIIVGLLLVYIFSFSTLLFSTVAETFIYASFFLIMFWNYALGRILDNVDLRWYDCVYMVLLGVSCFGITLTNYISYLIGLFGVIFSMQCKICKKIRTFTVINVVNGLLILALAKIQQLSWKGDTPFFLDSLIVWITNPENYEEVHYMDFTLSLEKLHTEFIQIFEHSFFAGKIIQVECRENYHPILFDTMPCILRMITIAIFICLIVAIVWNFFSNLWRENLLLTIVLGFNVLLHYFYGAEEAFMYTPHYFFVIILIFGIALSSIKHTMVINVCKTVVFFIATIELFSNAYSYKKLIYIISNYCGNMYSVKKHFFSWIITLTILLMIVIAIVQLLKNKIEIKGVERQIRPLFPVCFYIVHIMICTWFIWLNY